MVKYVIVSLAAGIGVSISMITDTRAPAWLAAVCGLTSGIMLLVISHYLYLDELDCKKREKESRRFANRYYNRMKRRRMEEAEECHYKTAEEKAKIQ